MPVLTIDFETHRTEEISLSKMTLRNYLKAAPIIGVSAQEDGGQAFWIPAADPAFMEWVEDVRAIAEDDAWVIQGHNGAGFDARVLRFGRIALDREPLNLPWPLRVHDSMELAMAAWPCQPGGYGLKNLSEWLHLPPKLSLEDAEKGRISWEEYCTRDCSNSYEIYRRAVARLSPDELFTSELANRVRGMHFEVSAEQVKKSFEEFRNVTNEAVRSVFEHVNADGDLTLGADAEAVFGLEGDEVRSVKAAALKRILLERLGFDTHTTSMKKINPTKLAHAPEVAQILKATGQANRGLFYRRRARDLAGVAQLDMELGYARATNTLRYSSPTTGRGANLHNLAKRDVTVAKPLRQMLTLPDDQCFVCADASNVEYRVEGLLTGCQYVRELFENNINADPYAAFAYQAFGVKVEKKGPTAPLRQLAKNAVLGLGYKMGLVRWMEEMNKTLADPTAGVSLADVARICADKKWGPPTKAYVKGAQTRTNSPWEIAAVAVATREAFHLAHHEFFTTALWLERTVAKIAGAVDPEQIIDACYELDGAPNRDLIDLSVDTDLEYPSVRVRLLNWSMPTVTWRHLSVSHPGVDGLGAVTANKGPRRVYQSIFIENVTQSGARNPMVKAKHELVKRGWPVIMSVHDELKLIVPRERNAVLKARDDLANVMGPALGYKWAFYAKKADISISRSMYEDEDDSKLRWPKIEAGDPDMFLHLP
jgi:hypothetical protein